MPWWARAEANAVMLVLVLLLFLATVEIVWLGSRGCHRGARQVLRDGSKPMLPARHRRDHRGAGAGESGRPSGRTG